MYSLKQIDPEGSNNRRSHKIIRREYRNAGANSCWHVDSYDELKPFGFPIHGCTDGYSRKIICLKTVPSNNNPFIIGEICLEHLKQHEGCPSWIRTDCGSENVVLAAIQSYLRRNHLDKYTGLESHIFGTSHGNQRIESWWSQYRGYRNTDIIDFFKYIVDDNIYNPADPLHLHAARYCFCPINQKDLDSVAECWNSHQIRPSFRGTIPGIPGELYSFLEIIGAKNMILPIHREDIEDMDRFLDGNISFRIDDMEERFVEYCEYIRQYEDQALPQDWVTAKSLFMSILSYGQDT